MKLEYNKSSLLSKLEGLSGTAEEKVKDEFTAMAQDATTWAMFGSNPASKGWGMGGGVDTGAYITSFSFSTGAGRPRGKSSRGKPRKQNHQEKANEGLNLLLSDLEKIDFTKAETITFRNGSPHAGIVENKHGLLVFAKLKVKYGGSR